MITIKNLHKYYKMDKGKSFHALKGLNIKFPNKGFVFVAGKSGCGKSTLMNVLGGLDTYDKGNLIVGNKSTKNFTPEDMDNYRNSYLGFIFQDFHLIDGETIFENVSLALQLQGYPKEKIPKQVTKYLKMVDLLDKKNNKISEISGGQKQRVAIARALIKNPKVIIADEPTGNLDSKTGLLIMKILKKLSKTKLVIMVTHDLDYAEEFADRLIQLKDGEITSDKDFSKLDYSKNGKLRFKRSRFPFNMALKMAWTSVVRKKFRLILTILLFAVSIGLFSFITSFNFYSTEDLFYQFVEETDTRSIQFSEGRNENYELKNSLDENGVNNLKQRYPSVTFGRMDYNTLFRVQECGFDSQLCSYTGRMTYVEEIENLELDILYGTDTLSEQGVIISDVAATYLVNGSEFIDMESLIGKTNEDFEDAGINFNLIKFTIDGIYNTNMLNKLKDYDQQIKLGTFQDYQELQKLYQEYTYVTTNLDTFVETYDMNGKADYTDFFYTNVTDKTKSEFIGTMPQNENEVMYTVSTIQRLSYDLLSSYVEDGEISQETLEKKIEPYNNAFSTVCSSYSEEYDIDECKLVLEDLLIDVNNLFDMGSGDFDITLTPTSWSRITYEEQEMKSINLTKVTGIALDSRNDSTILSKKALEKYLEEKTNIEGSYSSNTHNLVAILSGSTSSNQDFIRLLDHDYSHTTDASMALNILDTFLNPTIMRTFLIISAIFGAFASVLMFSYINQSIRFKRADIGTLRAIGAKGTDVGKIFITEAMIISAIASLFAIVALNYAVIQLNGVVDQSLNLSFNFFYIHWAVYLILLAFAAVIAFISCIIPLIRLIKMSPIDVIRKARD